MKDDISVKYSESYEGVMEKIANSNYIIMILSREFFRSRHCMYEAILSLTKQGYDKKIIPIVTIKKNIK
ncbi:toll/interleukin-1 receptor domain-containing protein [Clostridium butyricum]